MFTYSYYHLMYDINYVHIYLQLELVYVNRLMIIKNTNNLCCRDFMNTPEMMDFVIV